MPPSLSEYERLFLLEFYVDYVTIQNIAFDFGESKLCVSFQFLHYPIMRVCEVDFKPETPKPVTEDSKIVFKSGKSCMFSVHPDENNTISSSFNLIISVCQTREGCTRKELVGQAAVNLGASFLNLLQPTGDLTMDSGTKYDLFPLKDKFKRVVGSVAAFARLSNFGKMIVTQFQLAEDNNMNYMFKGTDPNKLFKDDPAMRDFPKIVSDEPRSSEERKPFSKPPSKSLPSKNIKSTYYDDDSCSDDTDSCSNSTETNTDADDEDDGKTESGIGDSCEVGEEKKDRYKEIEAEVNGQSIVIRVLKKERKPKKLDTPPICCVPPEPPICPNAPKLNVCDCDFPLPPELIPRCPEQCCMRPCNPAPTSSSVPQKQKTKRNSRTLKTTSGITKNNSATANECPREDCPLNLFRNTSQLESNPNGEDI